MVGDKRAEDCNSERSADLAGGVQHAAGRAGPPGCHLVEQQGNISV